MSALRYMILSAVMLSQGDGSDYSERELWVRDGWDVSPIVNEVCKEASRWRECAALAEARFLELYPVAKRDSGGVSIRLSSGQTIRLNENPSIGDDDLRYRYLGMVEPLPYHLLKASGNEWHSYLMIHAGSGHRTRIDSFPSVSPGGERVATARINEFDDIPNCLSIWTTRGDSLRLEATLDVAEIRHPDPGITSWAVARPRWKTAHEIMASVYAQSDPRTGYRWLESDVIFTFVAGRWSLK